MSRAVQGQILGDIAMQEIVEAVTLKPVNMLKLRYVRALTKIGTN